MESTVSGYSGTLGESRNYCVFGPIYFKEIIIIFANLLEKILKNKYFTQQSIFPNEHLII